MSDTGFDSSVGKWALHKAGIRVHHLSRPEHGYSSSRLGLRLINRLRTEVEDQWLASRIRVEGQATGAMRKADRILRQGGVVSIKAGAFEGAQFLEVTRGPRRFRLGAGAPSLCHSSGAALFGVFVSRMQGQDFLIHVGSKIEISQDSDRRQASLACAAAFADQINAFIELHPGQWLGGYEIPLEPGRPATLVQA
jgi:lauroyl/myristoyl acyltransferase